MKFEPAQSIENLTLSNKIGKQKMMLNFGNVRTLANHASVAYLAYMGEPPLPVQGQKFDLEVTDDVRGQVKRRIFDFSGLVTSASKISM